MSKGHIRQRGDSFELKFDLGRDPTTGKRRIQYHTVRGTKRDAQAKLRALMKAVDEHSFVEPSKLTVADYMRDRVAQWETSLEPITRKTAERYRELVKHQIVPHLGAMTLQKLKPADIEGWHGTLKASGRKDGKGGVSARTIVQAHRVLQRALREAHKNDLVSKNVGSLQRAPKVKREEVEILDPEQVASVVTKLRTHSRYPVFVTALFTGMRRGELLALRWSTVNLDKKTLQVREALEECKRKVVDGNETGGVRVKGPKTDAGVRDIALPDIVVDVLRNYRRTVLEQRLALGLGKLPDDALMFPGDDGTYMSPAALTNAWRRAAKALAFDGVTLHALRHTHASQLIEAGVDIVTISRRLGHASANITLAVYAHLFRKSDDKAAAAINSALAGLGAS